MNIQKTVILISILTIVTVGESLAQTSKGGRKIPAPPKPPVSDSAIVILFPDIIHNDTNVSFGDTTMTYEYVDRAMRPFGLAFLKNADDIDNIKYYKSYPSPTSNDNSGAIGRNFIMALQTKYVHPNAEIWLAADHITHRITRYKLFKNKIVRTKKMTFTDPKTKATRHVIYKYYKTKVESSEDEK